MNAKLLPLAVIGVAVSLASPLDVRAASDVDLRALCARLGNDDTIREYSPSLRAATTGAFKTLFPDAKGMPDDDQLKLEANFRCMNGKALVCFIGANLPCVKMDTSRDNAGANEFCRSHPHEGSVPAGATGHDALYSYRCHDGRAEITRELWELDALGFAKELWAEVSDR